jgi:hypothetical protein
MDPERVPPLHQSEITSPFNPLDKDTSGTIQPDPFSNPSPSHSNIQRTTARINTSNLSGNAPTDPASPEKLEVSEIVTVSFLQLQ